MSETQTFVRQGADFFRDLVRVVLVQPVRRGTLDVAGHSRGVAGIACAVAILYAMTVGSILVANPLRAASELESSVDEAGNLIVPTFLIPAVLCLLGVSFALLLSGSQRAPWWRRILYLIAVEGILGSATAISVGFGERSWLTWVCCGLMALTLLYTIVVWLGRTPAATDAFVFLILCSGVLLTAYRTIVAQTLMGASNGSLVTVSLLLTFVGTLALPIAFLSGVNATAFGVSIISWAGDELGKRSAVIVGGAVVTIVLAWQWLSVVRGLLGAPFQWIEALAGLLAALVVVTASAGVWWLAHRSARAESASLVEVAAAGVGVALPVAYGLASAAMIGSFLGLIAVPLNSLVSAEALEPVFGLTDIVGSNVFVTSTRVAVVIGLLVAAILLVRRGRHLLAGVAGVDAVVLASYFWLGRLLGGWLWTPSSIGNVGLIAATALLVAWALRRRLDPDRVGILLLMALLSALVRKADFFALPIGFLIGASATALLIVGLVWGFLTDGGDAHADARAFPKDRRLLVVLGTFLFGITIVAWAVIGKDVATSLVLSADAALGVQTIGSALIIAVVFAFAFPAFRRKSTLAEPVAVREP